MDKITCVKEINKKRFWCCLNFDGFMHYTHPRSLEETEFIFSLPNNVEIPHNRSECISHVGSSGDLHSVIIRINCSEERMRKEETVFFTAVNLMTEFHEDDRTS